MWKLSKKWKLKSYIKKVKIQQSVCLLLLFLCCYKADTFAYIWIWDTFGYESVLLLLRACRKNTPGWLDIDKWRCIHESLIKKWKRKKNSRLRTGHVCKTMWGGIFMLPSFVLVFVCVCVTAVNKLYWVCLQTNWTKSISSWQFFSFHYLFCYFEQYYSVAGWKVGGILSCYVEYFVMTFLCKAFKKMFIASNLHIF